MWLRVNVMAGRLNSYSNFLHLRGDVSTHKITFKLTNAIRLLAVIPSMIPLTSFQMSYLVFQLHLLRQVTQRKNLSFFTRVSFTSITMKGCYTTNSLQLNVKICCVLIICSIINYYLIFLNNSHKK